MADTYGGSGFIAAFVAGVVYGRARRARTIAAAFSEELGGVLNGVTFIVFGAAVLGSQWSQIGVAEVVYAVLSLTVVRMIPVAIAMLRSGARTPTVLFLGWFGPRGLASIVFGVVVIEGGGLPHTSQLIAVITTTVALSVFAHGASASPLARRYATWHAAAEPPMESEPTPRPAVASRHTTDTLTGWAMVLVRRRREKWRQRHTVGQPNPRVTAALDKTVSCTSRPRDTARRMRATPKQ